MATVFSPNVPDASWSTGMNITNVTPKNVPNRGPGFEAGSIVFLVIASVFVGLRLYTRITVVKALGMDDYFALLAFVLAAAAIVTVIVGMNSGMGMHVYDQTSEGLITVLKVTYASTIIIGLCIWALKASVMTLYLKMTPSESSRRIIYIIMAFVTMHLIAATLATIFQCTPISSFWNLLHFESKCIRILYYDIINSSLETVTDVIILILPIPIIRKLNMPKSKKRSLFILLGLGVITVVCGLIRTILLIIWVHSSDISWNFPLLPFISSLQVCAGLVASSAPAISPLFRRDPAKRLGPSHLKTKPFSKDPSEQSHYPTSHPSTYVQDEFSRTKSIEKVLVGICNMENVKDDFRQSWNSRGDVESLASPVVVSESLDCFEKDATSKDAF